MDDAPPSPLPETSIQEPGISGRTMRPEAPVDTMLKDMATIIFSTFLLAGWVAFVITYPKVGRTSPPTELLNARNYIVMKIKKIINVETRDGKFKHFTFECSDEIISAVKQLQK